MHRPKQFRLPEALPHEQVRALLAATRHPVYRAFFATQYVCGLRFAEARNFPPENVQAEKRLLRVIGKGDKERFVPLPGALLTRLREIWLLHRNPTRLFASRPSATIAQCTLYDAFHAAREEAGIPYATGHVFRHSYATRLLERGVQLPIVQILMGHARLSSTMIYTHLTEPAREGLRQNHDAIASDLP
jgi:site-specific recombinase XerD